MDKALKILFLSPEAVPFAKTGGLADVAGALPAALKGLGNDVRLILPLYRVVREGDFPMRSVVEALEAPLGREKLVARILKTETEDGVPVYLIQREDLYDRPNLYGNEIGDYYDNLERFTFYAHAALRLCDALSFGPDVIHCHDWQTGLIPALIKGPYRDSRVLAKTPTVFTLHNVGYRGLFPAHKLPVTGLPADPYFTAEGLEFWGSMSLLKAGIVYSEAITTVSPSYAQEIQTSEYGMGMEGILHHRQAFLRGILNGVDYRLWDPARDRYLPANYSPGKMDGKRLCKASLIQEMDLDPSLRQKPLIGMVSRLGSQKGLDLLVQILDDILAKGVGLAVLGAGDESIQSAIARAAERHPGRVALKIGFDEPLAHRIMAGVDIFLIPSRYEPCGLTQMYALKYGTVPVVRATGGLDDTIIQFDRRTKGGNGFKFGPCKPEAFLSAIQQAVDLFKNHAVWKKLMAQGMAADFSWDRSARDYLKLYHSVQPDSGP